MRDSITRGEFLGKYRAIVTNNNDPENRARLILFIPDVLGTEPSTWAECSVPFTGALKSGAGFFVIPPIDAAIWVEFECGNQDYPVWSGGRWVKEEDVPPMAFKPAPKDKGQNIVIQTTLKNTLVISDAEPGKNSGGIILKSSGERGATIVVNDKGIYLNNGKGASIEMTGNTVKINGTALVIK